MSGLPSRPSVDVVIPAHHDWDGVRRCLDAIEAQTYPAELVTTFVVNNDPLDPLPPDIAARDGRTVSGTVRILTEPRRGSYAARNAGVAAGHSEIVAFTDADCVPDPVWLERAVAAIVGGDDRIAGHIDVIPDTGRIGHAALHEVASAFDQRRYVRRGFGATANLVVLRRAFDLVGVFDPALTSGGDIEWNQRAGRAGLTLRYDRQARVAHPPRTSEADLLVKDARVWAGKVTIEEFPLVVLAVGAALQGLIPPVLPLVRAGLRTRGRLRVSLTAHLFWLWRFRVRRARRRVRLTVTGPDLCGADGNERSSSVVIAVGSLVGGGAERSSLLIARHWPVDHQLRPRLMVRELSGPFVDEIADGLPVDVVGGTRTHRVPIFLWRVRRTTRRHDVRAIISNSPRMSDVLLLGRRLRLIPCPVITVERTGQPSIVGQARWRPRSVSRWVRSSASRIVAVSEGVAQRVQSEKRYGRVATSVIPNAAAVGRRSGGPADTYPAFPRPRFITAGRLEPVKNHQLLLEAFHGLPDGIRGSLLILGEGSLRPQVSDLIRELGVADVVDLPGFVKEPSGLFEQSDVFVLSSDFEGHPRVLIEALLCGLRVVATDCPTGPREILEGVEGALLVTPGDALALRAGMAEMARASLDGSPARSSDDTAALVERFDPSRMARCYAVVVDEVLG